jgi:hypothetical protein
MIVKGFLPGVVLRAILGVSSYRRGLRMGRKLPKQVRDYLRTIANKGAGKGGHARRNNLTPERRREIAKNAARARWAKRKRER